MKKFKITMMTIMAILFSCVLLMGCINDSSEDDNSTSQSSEHPAVGQVLILQAYGNAGDSSPNGVSHSFVELYNISDSAIDLSGISLYFADGTSGIGVTQDGNWKSIVLTGTIPAKGSFLVLGKKYNDLTSTRYIIADNYGDINDDTLSLSRRGFKVAIINGTTPTVQNPFDSANGIPVSGYIDMVGAVNDPSAATPDNIFGYEFAPARCSASEAVRRINLIDTDDNSTDFESIRYASDGITNEVLAVRKPRKSSDGTWDPFASPPPPIPPPAATGNTLLIFQAYGGDNANGVTHHFVELYNNGSASVDLSGYSLQYASASDGDTPESDWTVINLTGSIPAKTSYLILGKKNNVQTQRIQIADSSGDINNNDFVLSNRGFKLALINGTTKLTVANPYNTDGNWTRATGYVDMVGCSNTFGTNKITGYEGPSNVATLPRNSAQEGIRRENLTDTDNNNTDFVSVRYTAARSSQYPHGVDAYEIAFYTPKNVAAGTWDPSTPPAQPPATGGSEKLMILQANTYGNNNGGAAGFARSLVELYNNTDVAINLTTGNYYLYIGNASAWETTIKLEGSIPAKGSFLIVDNTATTSSNTNSTPRATLPTADQEAAFVINNTNFKIALMVNLSTLSVNNPFTEASLTANYVDMLGTGSANGFETAAAAASKPQVPRRISLTDSDNNSLDFAQADYRGQSGNNGMADAELYKFWPRNSVAGAWDPITGLPRIDPTVVP
ncbi:lamin tail domain-containing protein [Treponema sp. R6D11]